MELAVGLFPPELLRRGAGRNATKVMNISENGRNDEIALRASLPSNLASPDPLEELDKWVSAPRLLEIVWDASSRPSLQWLRKETKRRMMPHLRRGRLIFYRPRSVIDWLLQKEARPNSMK